MNPVKLSIQNYRCFTKPTAITMQPGFTGFVGKNNSGKSTVLKMFYEFRPFFEMLNNREQLQALLSGQSLGFQPLGTDDAYELFSNRNESDIELSISVEYHMPGAE